MRARSDRCAAAPGLQQLLAGQGVERDLEALKQIVDDYRPYDTLPAFTEGFDDYDRGSFRNPYDGLKDGPSQVAAQAHDRGRNAAMRYRRHLAGVVDKPKIAARRPRAPAAANDDATQRALERICAALIAAEGRPR
jgi:hypothetical protein